MGENHHQNAKLILLNMIRTPPAGISAYAPWIQHLPIPQSTADYLTRSVEEWGLSETQLKALRRGKEFLSNGRGYMMLQTTRVSSCEGI